MSVVNIETVKVYQHGRPVYLKAVNVSSTKITIEGTLLRTATIHNEWSNTADAPEDISRVLRSDKLADIFTFWELFREPSALHDFPVEWVAISALPITTHEEWSTRQIRREVRKNIKKASRRGVEVRGVKFDDELVFGMTRIFNEAKVRQGKPFWHYGKGVEEVRDEMGQDLDRSHFIGAYFEGELIGFYKLIVERCFAQPVVSLSMIRHRDKYADTALISEAVKFCAQRGLRYLTYGEWRRDNHKEFLESHGFTRVLVPRYYVPLTFRGRVSLKLKAHKGVKELIKALLPEPVLSGVLRLRSEWYRLALRRPEAIESAK